MKNVIITGANGFLGSNLVKNLASNRIHVYAFVRNKQSVKLKDNENITIIECPMNEYEHFDCNIIKEPIDALYHFAWDGTAGSKRADYNIQLKNVKYTCDAVKLAKELNVKKFIFVGSIIEFEYLKCVQSGKNDNRINNMYGIAKLMSREMARILAENVNIEFVQTTISNIYGPGETSPRLLNSTLRKMLNGEKTSFTSCEQLYDFIYIDDAMKAYYLVGESGVKDKNYYIGNKNPRKLKEFIYEMRECIDSSLPLGFGEIPFCGVSLEYTEFNTGLLYDELKLETSFDFKKGLLKTIEWLERI